MRKEREIESSISEFACTCNGHTLIYQYYPSTPSLSTPPPPSDRYLQLLQAANNEIGDLGVLQYLPNLQYLDVSINRIDQRGLEAAMPAIMRGEQTKEVWLGSATQLLWSSGISETLCAVHLSHNRLTELGPVLVALTSLTDLRLAQNDLGGIAGVENLTRLNELHIQGNPRLESIRGVSHLTDLKTLLAFSNPRLSRVPSDMGRMTSLLNLDIGFTNISRASFSFSRGGDGGDGVSGGVRLPRLPSIERAYVDGTELCRGGDGGGDWPSEGPLFCPGPDQGATCTRDQPGILLCTRWINGVNTPCEEYVERGMEERGVGSGSARVKDGASQTSAVCRAFVDSLIL